MQTLLKSKRATTIFAYLQIFLGTLLGSMSYPLFLVPHHIAPGGVTGIATVLNHVWAFLPVGLTSLALNIPLFIFGYKYIGRTFVIRTLVATLTLSLFIDILKLKPATTNPLMAAIIGGALLGLGLAIIFRGGATTGGTDMLARMVHEKFSSISVGTFLFIFDCFVILLAGVLIHIENAMYAGICVFVCSRVVDSVLSGMVASKACYIISTKHDEIAARILKDVQRGATLFPAYGAYSKKEGKVLLCIASRMEIATVKLIVREIDPSAFMFITETKETLGEGFLSLSSK